MFQYSFASYCLLCHKIPCQGVCCGATSGGVISSQGFIIYYFVMKSYTRYTIRIKGKRKILSIQRPNNIKFWTLTPWRVWIKALTSLILPEFLQCQFQRWNAFNSALWMSWSNGDVYRLSGSVCAFWTLAVLSTGYSLTGLFYYFKTMNIVQMFRIFFK